MQMPLIDSFQACQTVGENGVPVLPRALVGVAASKAGYCIPSPVIHEATQNSNHMTADDFINLCEGQSQTRITPEAMSQALVRIAPSNIITCSQLEQLINENGPCENSLTSEEIQAFFALLDSDHAGYIKTTALMRMFYGNEGVRTLLSVRQQEVQRMRVAEEEHSLHLEAERAEAERIATQQSETEAQASMQAQAAEDEQLQQEAERQRLAMQMAEQRQLEREAALMEARKKKKASACC